MKKIFLAAVASASMFFSVATFADNECRFVHSGDGKMSVKNSAGVSFSGAYRRADCAYDDKAVAKIRRVFNAPTGGIKPGLSMRLIEFLDYLDDKLANGNSMTVISGYRSPAHNGGLRAKGRLAAKASMHQYGMAADVVFYGAHPKDVWDFVRELSFGGVGYYHGKSVHIDVGPARFWDETTTGVDTDASDDNKLIAAVTDADIYRTGDDVFVSFIRMTSFPVGVAREFELMKMSKSGEFKQVANLLPPAFNADCTELSGIPDLSLIRLDLPNDASTGTYKIVANFCGEMPELMPRSTETPPFEVR